MAYFKRLAWILVLLATALFLILPVFKTVFYLKQIVDSQNEIPGFVFEWHKQLSGKIGQWAEQRLSGQEASKVHYLDVSGTEWPIFSSVYYLWATEALESRARENAPDSVLPSVYARESIESGIKLIVDPGHAAWVKKHWGENYLTEENIFYRMLLISGLTSYQNITGNVQYEKLLRNQVIGLMAELDASPHGLLDDYPRQCYTIDIVPAIANIHRAGKLLGIDTTGFVARATRGFTGSAEDPLTKLPTYLCDKNTGKPVGVSRGVGVSYSLIWSSEIWPELSSRWYARYKEHFYLEKMGFAGVSAFAKSLGINTTFFDIDAGPIIRGASTAGSAFGIAASLSHGHKNDAYPLMAEAFLFSWPLPEVGLLIPKLLSNLTDAPFTGETAMLFILSRQPSPHFQKNENKISNPFSLPALFYVICILNLLITIWCIGKIRTLILGKN